MSAEDRTYYCAQHSPEGAVALKQTDWPFSMCVVCSFPATHFSVERMTEQKENGA